MNKVLILSCGTGGGHNSAALAIQEKLREKGVQADFIEYLSIINPKIKDRINHIYIKSTKGSGKVFKVAYHLGELYQRTKLKSPVYQLNSLNKKKLYEYIKRNKYNYIVTTHLFAAQALTAIKKEYPIHFIAVATDYVSIPFWEETNPDYFIIPSKELEEDFKKKKIETEKLLPLGIPVSKDYCQNYEKEICKQELNLDQNKKYILISTGSMGFGNVKQMVKELIKQIKDIVFIISCGHNIKLWEDLKNTYQKNQNIIVIPYTNRLSQYMKCSEIILSKPGGLTSTEIATLNKPLIHTMPIPGCENYNADFFSKRKMSIKCDTIQEIIDSTKKLLNNQELQKKMIKNQKKYISKNACDEIANVIIKNINEGENHERDDRKGTLFSIFSNLLYYGIAFPVLKIVTKLVYDLKIEGKKNLRDLKGGAVSVSNHVLVLDCAMVGLAFGFKKIYYTTQEDSFKIPVVRKLIKLLRAVPIPKSVTNKKHFINEVNHVLQKGEIVHFYPEAALWPYYTKIRNFKKGAFEFAIHNKVPIVPIIFKFREPKGIRKLFKRKKDVTLFILEPVKFEKNDRNAKQSVEELKQIVYEKMKMILEK